MLSRNAQYGLCLQLSLTPGPTFWCLHLALQGKRLAGSRLTARHRELLEGYQDRSSLLD